MYYTIKHKNPISNCSYFSIVIHISQIKIIIIIIIKNNHYLNILLCIKLECTTQ
jgi:hypothetical protein